jgi:hypothetical protein
MIEQYLSIHHDLSNLQGKPAWGLVRTHGSMFFLELGGSILRPGGLKAHGEWHFLIEMCQWRFDTKESILVGSEDDREFIDASFRRMELGVIERVEVTPPCHDLTLVFSSGIRLKTFFVSSAAKDEWTNWIFYCPADRAWETHGGGQPILTDEAEATGRAE